MSTSKRRGNREGSNPVQRKDGRWHVHVRYTDDNGLGKRTTVYGEPCDPRNALRALKVAAERANLPGVGLHTLRHSAATVMIENRVPLKVVSEILGHFSVSITGDIYGHVSPDVSAQAMDALGAALDG